MPCPNLQIKKNLIREGRAARLLHPWIFSGAISQAPSGIEPGSVVRVTDAAGEFVGYGHFNPLSSIAVRLLSFDEDKFPDNAFFFEKIRDSIMRRRGFPIRSDARRLIFSESDLLPGLIVDRYASVHVVQTLTAGMDRIKGEICSAIAEIDGAETIIERNDCEIRKLEGLEPRKSVLMGKAPEPEAILIHENNFRFELEPFSGQKTGFYMDQRENRAAVASYVAPGMEMLDCFSFSGGFSVYASGAGAASLTLLDESESSLALARRNLSNNPGSAKTTVFIRANAFKALREFRDSRKSFDMIILDPPKFAPSSSDVEKAYRAYKDINLFALKLLKPGGILATFSCSSGFQRQKFFEVLCAASRDAGRCVSIVSSLTQACAHPIRIGFPESEYLKGFILKALD